MNIVLRRAPGGREPADDKLLFSERAGSPSVAEVHIYGGGEPLRQFLLSKLEVRAADASRIITEQDAYGVSLPPAKHCTLKVVSRHPRP